VTVQASGDEQPMVTNRSVPANIILPHTIYRNVAAAPRRLTVEWDATVSKGAG
jgi:hypothetical protein